MTEVAEGSVAWTLLSIGFLSAAQVGLAFSPMTKQSKKVLKVCTEIYSQEARGQTGSLRTCDSSKSKYFK